MPRQEPTTEAVPKAAYNPWLKKECVTPTWGLHMSSQLHNGMLKLAKPSILSPALPQHIPEHTSTPLLPQ